MEIYQLGAVQLAAELAKGSLSSVEVTRALLERADEVNATLNILVHQFDESAIDEAEFADASRARSHNPGPLLGMPVTIKESIATRGVPVTLGVKSKMGAIAPEDAAVVAALRKAGAVILGKTNVSQGLLFHESDNKIWGATKNPWNLSRTPGGSSGGEAAALAAGITPLGVGTDIGGSIRVPAAFCGIAGLKPTWNRWSNRGCGSALNGQESIRAQCGPMARQSIDVDFFFRALDSHLQARVDSTVPPCITPDPSRVEVRHLRIGFYEEDGFLRPARSVIRGVNDAARALEKLGAEIIPFPPPRALEVIELYYALVSADGGNTFEHFLDGDPVMPQLSGLRRLAKIPAWLRGPLANYIASKGEENAQRLIRQIGKKSVQDLWRLNGERSRTRDEILRAWNSERIDVVLCPAHATSALQHGASADFSVGGTYSMRYNLLDFPAGVAPVSRVRIEETVPVHSLPRDRFERHVGDVEIDSENLPLGVQVVARPHHEHLVLAVMSAIEESQRSHPSFPTTPV